MIKVQPLKPVKVAPDFLTEKILKNREAPLPKPLFEWPTPDYFKIGPAAVTSGTETCLVYLRNGKKVLGELIRFSPEETSIVFLPIHEDSSQVIGLDQIKHMRLVQPLAFQLALTLLEERATEVFPPSECQDFSVEFFDKEIMSGQTVGHVDTTNGLYLFLQADDKKIIRCFIPHQAIKRYQIGLLIGEILVEEKLASKGDVEQALTRQRALRVQRIGEFLAEHQIVSREQLDKAIQHQESQPILKLGEALQQLNLLTQEQLDTALAKQKQNRKVQLGQILIEMGIIDEVTLKGTLAKKLGIPYVSLSKFNFDLNVIRLVTSALARKLVLMPLCLHDNALVVAMEDPLNGQALEELRFQSQLKIVPAMSSREDILSAIGTYYSGPGGNINFTDGDGIPSHGDLEFTMEKPASEANIDELATKLFDEDIEMETENEPVAESDNTLVQLVNKMIMDAYQDGVSDIHIETYAGKHNTRVRFRKDGTLVSYLEIPANFRNALISRIKIMAQLDISERRKPQDGKIDFQNFGPAKIELRVATVPTANSLEDIVMRVLSASKPVAMDKLGLAPDIFESLKKLMLRPYGLILVCGPTGSGKTTTLHSLIGSINTPDRKIWTAEDPVEITQAGLRQVQVNAKIGWTFAGAMRSFLRADPDVIMVGEMRDQETTKIGIEASLTGHLVLSTLHTNSAPESVVRLLDLGMDPFNFADALLAILAQRLAKSLCADCKESHTPTAEEIKELAEEYAEGTEMDTEAIIANWKIEHAKDALTLNRAKGCRICNNTGYRGRIGIHELMTVSSTTKRLIQTRAPVSELVPAAIADGMRTLKQDGILKVLQGHTDMLQIRAVCT